MTIQYIVCYQGQFYPAIWYGNDEYLIGDQVIVEWHYPSKQLTILGSLMGDSTEGTPYGGTGGVNQPSDGPNSTATSSAGYFNLDSGPGFDLAHIHP